MALLTAWPLTIHTEAQAPAPHNIEAVQLDKETQAALERLHQPEHERMAESLDTIQVASSSFTLKIEEERKAAEAKRIIEQQKKAAQAARIAPAQKPKETPRPVALAPAAPQPAGDVEERLKAATVAAFGEGHWPAMRNIIMRESGMNPNARNPSSGACGLFQALPCSKMGGTGVENQIQWGIGYVRARYGTPQQAWAFWLANHWY